MPKELQHNTGNDFDTDTKPEVVSEGNETESLANYEVDIPSEPDDDDSHDISQTSIVTGGRKELHSFAEPQSTISKLHCKS